MPDTDEFSQSLSTVMKLLRKMTPDERGEFEQHYVAMLQEFEENGIGNENITHIECQNHSPTEVADVVRSTQCVYFSSMNSKATLVKWLEELHQSRMA